LTAPAELARGRSGEAVRDLQHRLGALGHDLSRDEAGRFGDATDGAVRHFQEARGLRVDGICGRQTWSALVESGFDLGDRLLYERRPMLRGDDVGELQRRLNTLGFDAGREDGILGPDTARALREFQRNAGLATDGIGGPHTLDTLRRLGTLSAGSVASVREREELRRGRRRIDGQRIYLAVAPSLQALGDAVARSLIQAGAHPLLDASGADSSVVAAAANHFEAELFLAVRPGDAPGCRCSYFASGAFRSEAGYRLAVAIQEELSSALGAEPDATCGKAYALLRETRMAAVVCEPVPEADVDGMRRLVTRGADAGRAIARGVRRGVEDPPADDAPAERALASGGAGRGTPTASA
jgi:N-acetylmuramoyl-L-alanine amidase